jgi:pyruvate carboxylase
VCTRYAWFALRREPGNILKIMGSKRLLIANRGEIAIRIARAAADLGIRTVAIYAEDDAASLHTRRADEARQLRGRGVAPYLDIEQIIAIARDTGCDSIHPGYGFLSENAAFARCCAEVGLTFIGPRPELLELFGDKVRARALAEYCGVPVIVGTRAASAAEIEAFYATQGPDAAIVIKAVAGGGGRGMRIVRSAEAIADAFARCQSEARAAFGTGDLYAERLVERARHIEVQIAGDGAAESIHLFERECTIQRRHQKLVEIAPSPSLAVETREQIIAAALRMAREVRYSSLGTFEFLVVEANGMGRSFFFIETNPRLQVEHTVTEEVTGIDLVRLQLQLARGTSLTGLELTQPRIPAPRGYAIQMRINLEAIGVDGVATPGGGTLTTFEPPSGPGVRVDTFGYTGYTTSPRFDSLLAKLVVYSSAPDYAAAVRKAYRTLSEFRVEGATTNLGFLQNLLRHEDIAANRVYTRFVEDHAAELADESNHRRLRLEQASVPGLAGVKLTSADPLAVLAYGKAGGGAAGAPPPALPTQKAAALAGPAGTIAMTAPIQGTIVSLSVSRGEAIRKGQQILVMEAMKMEHEIRASVSGIVREITVAPGDAVLIDYPLAFLEEAETDLAERTEQEQVNLDRIRPDLAEVYERHAIGLDGRRPDAVERRRKTGQRTARENIEDLCDPGTFVEYGALVIAAQRRRRELDDLIKRTDPSRRDGGGARPRQRLALRRRQLALHSDVI